MRLIHTYISIQINKSEVLPGPGKVKDILVNHTSHFIKNNTPQYMFTRPVHSVIIDMNYSYWMFGNNWLIILNKSKETL